MIQGVRRRRSWFSRAMALVAVAVVASGCDVVRDAASGGYNGVELTDLKAAPEISLTDADGQLFDLAAQRGKVVLLFFGFTHCPDICPTTLADWARVRAALGADAEKVRFVFVSVDGDRDTPAISQAYAAQFDPSFIGLTADDATIARLRTGLNLVAQTEEPDSSGVYGVAHSSQVYLVDREGRLRILYPFGSTSGDMLGDIQRLIR